jgi:hypothetical protein
MLLDDTVFPHMCGAAIRCAEAVGRRLCMAAPVA